LRGCDIVERIFDQPAAEINAGVDFRMDTVASAVKSGDDGCENAEREQARRNDNQAYSQGTAWRLEFWHDAVLSILIIATWLLH